MSDINKYFKDTDAFIEGNNYLRSAQRMAYKAIKKAFIEKPDTHKIIVLATGAGKTGVMAIAPFNISDGRVLIITPGLIIREGISDAFDTRTDYNFWSERKVILDDTKLPKVYRYAGYNTKADRKRICTYLENSNIVIANIQKVYNNNSNKDLIKLVDKDFFDMIIVDEAHHSAADSWIKAFEYFNAKKIIKLTATPFRADEKELGGDIIYEYSLADAIKDNVVKNIVEEDYTSQKLEFEVNGKLVSKEEAMEIMDKNWVTRSVAYSRKCSEEIVKMSVKRLNEKRRLGKAHHQIVAVACSIKHAEEIMEIYREYGLTSDYVASDRIKESEQAIINFKKGIIDVLVNVDMLSEGFDHPNISIAAIFRPFRTLSPYAQFIGRALRKIHGENINDSIDNIAHIIYHKELGLDELWEYYTGQKKISSIKREIEIEATKEFNAKHRDVGNVVSDGNLQRNVRTYLGDNIDKAYFKEIENRVNQRNNEVNDQINKMKLAGVSEKTIQEYKELKKKEIDQEVDNRRKMLREELIREELHEHYIRDIENRVTELYDKVKINPKGIELPSNSGNVFLKNSGTNDAYIMKYINSNVKKKLKRSIEEWETYDFEAAEKLIPQLIDKIKDKYEGVCKQR